jgi:arylsulfatase A-like enzyme
MAAASPASALSRRARRRAARLPTALLACAVATGCGQPPGADGPVVTGIAPLDPTSISSHWQDPGNLVARGAETDGHFRELRIAPGSPDALRHFYGGWGPVEGSAGETRVWSIGPRSGFRFDLAAPRPLTLVLRCFPFQPPGGREQRVQVWLNQAYLTTEILKNKEAAYEIPLPAEALRDGTNHIELRYAWTEAPARVIPDSTDPRELAISVREVVVRASGPVPAGPSPVGVTHSAGGEPAAGLLQEERGELSFLSWSPLGAELEIGWALLAGDGPLAGEAAFRIELEWDQGRRTLLEGTARKRSALVRERIPLELPQAQAVRLHLSVTELPAQARWVWIDPRILAPPADPSPPPARAAEGTNVVFFLLDAASRNRFGVYGHPDGTTPSIDAIAQESLVFESAFSQASYTKASTASLFTSLTPAEHGMLEDRDHLPTEIVTLAEALRDAGYSTAAFSGNPFVSSIFGMLEGFDEGFELFRGLAEGEVARAIDFETPVLEWIEEHRDERFFAYIHYVQPHEPYNAAPPEFYQGLDESYQGPYDGSRPPLMKLFRREVFPREVDRKRISTLYDGNLRYADEAFGRLVRRLREMDLLDRSIVIVTADHGESLGERATYGHGHTLDAELVWLPLVLRLPPELGRRGRISELVGLQDMMPTLLETLGVPVPDGVRGRNVLRPPAGASGWPQPLVSVAAGRGGMVGVLNVSCAFPSKRTTGTDASSIR